MYTNDFCNEILTTPASNEDREKSTEINYITDIGDLIDNPQFSYAECCHELNDLNPSCSNTGGASQKSNSAPPICITKLDTYCIPVFNSLKKVDELTPTIEPQKTIIDYLTFTSPYSVERLVRYMSKIIPGLEIEDRKIGFFGYEKSWVMTVGGENIGIVASEMDIDSFRKVTFGPDGRELPRHLWEVADTYGRNLFSLSGSGCKYIKNWVIAYKLLKRMDARITRVDISMDFYHGEVTYKDAFIAAYAIPEDGAPRENWKIGDIAGNEFLASTANKSRGIFSNTYTPTDHRGTLGKTLNIGAPKGAKRCCIYEKGYERYNKLIGIYQDDNHDLHSTFFTDPKRYGCPGNTLIKDWLRVEVRFGNCDNVLDLDMVIFRDKYFRRSYPFCERIIGKGDGMKPKGIMKRSEVDIAKLTYYAKQGYGGLVYALKEIGHSNDEIINSIIGDDFSKRLKNDGVLIDILELQQKYAHNANFIGPVYPSRD